MTDKKEVLSILLDTAIATQELGEAKVSRGDIQFSSKDAPFFEALKGLAIAMGEGDSERAARRRVNLKIEIAVEGASSDS
ncbi:hypothetical protein OAO10_00120 [Luminiphilus sp.]|nr:hypothetical protein [Luminiphilus sp.]